jgi:hypothetical protein
MKCAEMMTLLDWLHNSVRGESLRIVKITDLEKTILGLQDGVTGEVYAVGNLHDLTFVLEGNKDKF